MHRIWMGQFITFFFSLEQVFAKQSRNRLNPQLKCNPFGEKAVRIKLYNRGSFGSLFKSYICNAQYRKKYYSGLETF